MYLELGIFLQAFILENKGVFQYNMLDFSSPWGGRNGFASLFGSNGLNDQAFLPCYILNCHRYFTIWIRLDTIYSSILIKLA